MNSVHIRRETTSRRTWLKASVKVKALSGDTVCFAYIHRKEDIMSFYYDGMRIMVGRYLAAPEVEPLVKAVYSFYLRTGSRELRVVLDPTHSSNLRLGNILLG